MSSIGAAGAASELAVSALKQSQNAQKAEGQAAVSLIQSAGETAAPAVNHDHGMGVHVDVTA